MDRTGHRSLDGLRKYEQVSEKQKEAACKVLAVKPGDSVPEGRPETSGALNPVSLIPPAEASSGHMFLQKWNMHLQNSLQQPQPSCSFGSASLQGCTINIFQAPQNTFQVSQAEAKELFEGGW